MAIYLSHYWSFGDGLWSTEERPIHIYKMAGIYLWTHTVSDNFGHSGSVSDYVYVYDYDYLGGINVSTTDKCLRHAIPQCPSQGIGWSIYDDVVEDQKTNNFPFPEGVVGCCEILDDNEQKRQLVLDARTCRYFEFGVDDEWEDGKGDYAGNEVESEITFREHMPPVGANALLKHSQTNINLKPWFKDYKGASGYNSEGFKANFESDLYIKVDSNNTQAAVTKQVPLRGQLVYDRHLESEFLQQGLKIRGAPWRLVSAQMWYKQIDSSAAPPKKQMKEYEWMMEFTEPVAWFPRSETLYLNYATGNLETGSSLGRTTGRDGYNSAVVMGIANSISFSPGTISGDFTIYAWLSNVTSGMILYQQGNLTITLNSVGGIWQVNWNDGVDNINIDLASSLNILTQIAVIRNGNTVVVYENYQLANTVIVSSSPDFTGVATILSGGVTWSDFRLLGDDVSSSSLEYFYRDMVENKGNATCPVF